VGVASQIVENKTSIMMLRGGELGGVFTFPSEKGSWERYFFEPLRYSII